MDFIALTQKINDGFVQITTLTKSAKTTLLGYIGDLTKLNTTDKSSLVNAINEVKSASGGSASISDTTKSTTTTWSSTKTDSAIAAMGASIINGAGADSDSLKELADKITALAQTDSGLISAKVAQSFTDTEKAQARSNIDVYSKAEIGDIANTNFVNTINTVFNS